MADRRKKAIVSRAVNFAQSIVDARARLMYAIEVAYFEAHPEALKYRDEIMAEANKLVPRS